MVIQVHDIIRIENTTVEPSGGPGPEMGGNFQTPRLGQTCFPDKSVNPEYVLCTSRTECDAAKIDGVLPYGSRDKLEVMQLRPGHVAIRLGDCEIWIDCSCGLGETDDTEL